jgi:flagellar motor switch protein FliM
MIEPLRELLAAGIQSDRSEFDDRWPQSLRHEVMAAKVEMIATLAEAEVTLGDVMRLQAGDIIPIEMPRAVTATVEGVPVIRGSYGASHGNVALKVTERIQPQKN